MKKAWYIFKEYYLFSILFIVVMLFIFIVTAKADDDYLAAKYAWLFIMISMLLVSTIDLIKEEYYKPKRIKKLLTMNPFSGFKNKGFKSRDNELRGQISGYDILIGIQWESYQKKPLYYFRALYNPMSYQRFLRQDEIEKFNDLLLTDNMIFYAYYISKEFSLKWFSSLSYNTMLNDIYKAINFLKARKLHQVDYEKWESFHPELDEHIENFVY